MRFLTAGESHGKALVGIIEGFPAGVKIDADRVNAELKRRQSGYGRGGRMQIENDKAEFLSGMRGGITTGAPIAIIIQNKDYAEWEQYMDTLSGDREGRAITAVRPGHADLPGAIKYNVSDARYIAERASARETAMRTAIGAIAKELLYALKIEIFSHVINIGGLKTNFRPQQASDLKIADYNDVRCMDTNIAELMRQAIDIAKNGGDTLGGEAEIFITGVKPGIGSHVHFDRKLDFVLMGAIGGIQAVKSVSIGDGYRAAGLVGSAMNDEIFWSPGGIIRKTNRAGGIEGGISNGEDIVVRAVMKPIPTLMRGMNSIDLVTKAKCVSASERSDVCAVPALSVVAENVAAFAIADEILKVTGGDYLSEIIARY